MRYDGGMVRSRTKGFLLALGASVAATAASGLLFLLLIVPRGPGAGRVILPLAALALFPVAAAAVFAGVRADDRAGVLLNSLAFLLPIAAGFFGGFFIVMHPGGPGGEALVLGSGAFWLELGAVYLFCVLLVGGSSALARRLLGPRP